MSDNRNLTPAPPPGGVQRAPTLDFSQIPPDIMSLAASIAGDVQSGGGSITPAQALAAAYHFTNTGETPGRHSYIGTRGGVAGKVLEGYRGVARELDMSKYQFYYRPLTVDEEKLHEINNGDRALICVMDVLKTRRECMTNGIAYKPILGITVIRKGEPLNVPKTKTAYWVLCKQARVDALRQVGENTSSEETLDDAHAAGLSVTRPDGYISQEQAEQLVRAALAAAERPTMTPEQLQTQLQANVLTMRGAKSDDPLGIDTPIDRQTIGAEERAGDVATDAEFTSLPAAPQSASSTPSGEKINYAMASLVGGATSRFPAWANSFSQIFPAYRKSDGTGPDMVHILQAVTAEGFKTIDVANFDAVCKALETRAEKKVVTV